MRAGVSSPVMLLVVIVTNGKKKLKNSRAK